MRPIDIVTQREWAGNNCDIVLERIRKEVDAELRTRDASRGIPQRQDLFDENGVKIGTVENFKVYLDDGKRLFVVDQNLSSLKHRGRERRLMIKRRWIQFCSERRDEAAEAAAAGMTERENELATMLESTREVEASDNSIGIEVPPPAPASETATMGEPDPIPEFVVKPGRPGKPFACDQCDRSFAKKNHLANHKKSHTRETVGV